MKNKSTASKVLSKMDYDEYKRGNDKSIIKSTTEKINTLGEKQTIKSGSDFAKDAAARSLMTDVKMAAKNLNAAGQKDKAKELLEKAMKSNSFKRIASKAGKSLLSSIPLIGGLASAFESGDVSAAVPILGDSESTGPAKGSIESKLEDPKTSQEERKRLSEIFKKRMMKESK